MNYTGLVIAVVNLLVIGLFHPLVIWGEYYFTKKNMAGVCTGRLRFHGLVCEVGI